MSDTDSHFEGAIRMLELAKKVFPDLRLCQIIGNATGKQDPYYVTDATLSRDIEAFIAKFGDQHG